MSTIGREGPEILVMPFSPTVDFKPEKRIAKQYRFLMELLIEGMNHSTLADLSN